MDRNFNTRYCEDYAFRKEYFRSRLKETENEYEDVLHRFYGVSYTGPAFMPMRIDHRVCIDSLLWTYGKQGYAILSVPEPAKVPEAIKALRRMKLKYLPLYRRRKGAISGYDYLFVAFGDGLGDNFSGDLFSSEYDLFANPIPMTLNERQMRDGHGEIMLI